MSKESSLLVSRRQAILSLAAIGAGTLIKPTSIFGVSPVKDKIRFAIVGDVGTGDGEQIHTARQMTLAHRKSPYDFVVAAGDNVYPNGSGRYFVPHFEEPFADLIRDRVSFYAVLGNHDVKSGREDQCQYPLFNMKGRCYYTLKQGDGLAELFMIDSTDFDNAQAAWLEDALKKSTAKWKIAVFHHPIYSSGTKHGSDMHLRRQIEPLLTRYGVKVVFSAHDHIYERTKLQNGIQYFVTGAGGQHRRGDVNLKSEFRVTSYDDDNQFMVIEIDDKQIAYQAICENGTVLDSGTIS